METDKNTQSEAQMLSELTEAASAITNVHSDTNVKNQNELTLSEYTKKRMSRISSARRIISRTMKNCQREEEENHVLTIAVEVLSLNLDKLMKTILNYTTTLIFPIISSAAGIVVLLDSHQTNIPHPSLHLSQPLSLISISYTNHKCCNPVGPAEYKRWNLTCLNSQAGLDLITARDVRLQTNICSLIHEDISSFIPPPLRPTLHLLNISL